MSNSDETLKKTPANEPVLQAIAELSRTVAELSRTVGELSGKFDSLSGRFDGFSNKFDDLEKFVTVQFSAVQEGIAYNSAKLTAWKRNFMTLAPIFPICEPTSKN